MIKIQHAKSKNIFDFSSSTKILRHISTILIYIFKNSVKIRPKTSLKIFIREN